MVGHYFNVNNGVFVLYKYIFDKKFLNIIKIKILNILK